MAYKAIRQINNGNGKYLISFIADVISDIASLPINYAIGSDAICLENSKKYILSPQKVWTEV